MPRNYFLNLKNPVGWLSLTSSTIVSFRSFGLLDRATGPSVAIEKTHLLGWSLACGYCLTGATAETPEGRSDTERSPKDNEENVVNPLAECSILFPPLLAVWPPVQFPSYWYITCPIPEPIQTRLKLPHSFPHLKTYPHFDSDLLQALLNAEGFFPGFIIYYSLFLTSSFSYLVYRLNCSGCAFRRNPNHAHIHKPHLAVLSTLLEIWSPWRTEHNNFSRYS